MSNLSLDWVALGISLAALLISAAALWQTSRFRRGDKSVELSKLAAEIGEKLGALAAKARDLKDTGAGRYAAKGMFQSGARIQFEGQVVQLLSDIDELQAKLATLSPMPANLPNRALEQRAKELWTLKLAADRVEANIKDLR